MIFKVILTILVLTRRGYATDSISTAFIQSFIQNEEKPTNVIFYDSCWLKKSQLSLVQEIMKTGCRVSTDAAKDIEHDHEHLFLLDIDCPKAIEKIKNISNLLRAPYRWLFLSNSTDSAAKSILLNSPALVDSDVVLAERNGDVFNLVEIHKPALNLSIIQTPRGIFNGSYHDVRPRRELYRRRMDLMGHTLTMSNVIQDSNKTQYHLPREDGLDFGNDATTKISWMVGKLAFLMLNATPRHIFSYRYGYKVNGQWSGMINDIYSGQADLGTNCVVTDPERFSIVSYTDTLSPFRVGFIFRQPPLSYVSNIYSLPFSRRVWVATALCAVVSATVLSIASKWEVVFGKSSTQLDGGMGDAMFLTMSALSQQGCVMEPRQNSGRVVVWSVFATLMALHAAYSANIVTLLQAPSRSVATLSQLVNSKITLAAYDVDYNHFIFAGLFAMHCIAEQVYRRVELTFHENEKCDLMEIDFMNTFYPYAPMRKHSPYLELMRVAFKRIRETGVNSALNRRHQTPKPRCAGHITSFSSVGAAELRPVLTLMAIGIGLAIVILCFEIIVHDV